MFEESEYKLLSRDRRDETSAWKGVKNVLGEGSTDRWEQTVGYWMIEDNNDGTKPKRAFPFLGGALRWYDDHNVSCKGANTKKADLNLPEEWTFDSDAKSPPVRSIDIDTGRPRAKPFFLEEPKSLAVDDGDKKRGSRSKASAPAQNTPFKNAEEDKDKESASRSRSDTSRQRTEEGVTRPRPRRIAMSMSPFYGAPSLASTEQRSIKVVEYVPPAKPRHEQGGSTLSSSDECKESSASACNNLVKPGIRRGENVYAVLRGASASSSSAANAEWLPGRVWDVKVKHESPKNGPVKTYDISE